MSKKLQIIGRLEDILLLDFGENKLIAKIDTGAYTSSLHCHHINEVEKEGKKMLEFEILDPKHPEFNNQKFYSEKYALKKVKSSNGIVSLRYLIKTKVQFGNKKYKIEFTLNNRMNMRYPVLLGRKFISGRFLVDVSSRYIFTRKLEL